METLGKELHKLLYLIKIFCEVLCHNTKQTNKPFKPPLLLGSSLVSWFNKLKISLSIERLGEKSKFYKAALSSRD